MLTKNELMLLNDVIYKIYTIRDQREMRLSVLNSLNMLIESDMSTFELSSKTEQYRLCDPVGIGTTPESMAHYLDEVQDYDYGRWTFAAPSGGVYRESDFMTDEKREQTPYYQNFFRPEGVHYSLMLVIIRNQQFYGCIALFRSKEKGDFSDRDQFLLSTIHDHLGWVLEQQKRAGQETTFSYPTREDLIRRFHLTSRESEIADLLLRGFSHKSICDMLHISPNTIKKHASNIYRKTKAHSWRELNGILLQKQKSD